MVRAVVDYGLSKAAAVRQFNTTAQTVAKWVERFRALGVDGLRDRSSRPLLSASQTPLATCAVIEALRRQRYTGRQIAVETKVSPATVSRVLKRLGLNRLAALDALLEGPSRQSALALPWLRAGCAPDDLAASGTHTRRVLVLASRMR